MLLAPTHLWRTPRVELFLLDETHVSVAYVRWLNDPAINQYLESRFVPHTIESTAAFVRSVRADPSSVFFGIRSLALDGAHVGNIKLGPISSVHGLAEIGLMIGERAAWGRGIGRDAIDGVTRIAFEQLGLRKVTAGCYASNVGSQRAFEGVGFMVEGVRKAHFVRNGALEDLTLLARWHHQSTH